jgi:hypothetical protein
MNGKVDGCLDASGTENRHDRTNQVVHVHDIQDDRTVLDPRCCKHSMTDGESGPGEHEGPSRSAIAIGMGGSLVVHALLPLP